MEKSNIGVISEDASNMMLHIKNDMENKLREAEKLKQMMSQNNQKKRPVFTPSESSSEEAVQEEYSESSEEDMEAKINYKNSAYWALPENVRHAIDCARKKSKHSDFYNRLRSLNDKIGVYKKVFYTKTPNYEKVFMERKRRRLEELMIREQRELENFMRQEARKAAGKKAPKRNLTHGITRTFNVPQRQGSQRNSP